MRKFLSILMLVTALVGQKAQALDLLNGFESTGEVGFEYRRDNLKLTSNAPTSFVSRHWNDLNVYLFTAKIEALSCNHIYLRAAGDVGTVDGRQHFYRNNAGTITTSDAGSKSNLVYDFDVALGYEFSFCCHEYFVIPLVGYAQHGLDLKNREITLIPGSHTSHNLRWDGFLVGFKAGWDYDCTWKIYGGYEYQPLSYRDNFSEFTGVTASYRQRSHHANGNYVYLGVNYVLCDNMYIGARFDYRYFTSGNGNENDLTAGISYNAKATWQSYGGALLVGYQF